MVLIRLLAQIIQGEAGTMGPLGMMAVALSLHCRIWQHGHDEARIAREWYGRAAPGPVALLLTDLVLERRLPDNDYYWAMGHAVDVQAQNFRRGDVVVMNHDETQGIHLYSIDHVPWEKE